MGLVAAITSIANAIVKARVNYFKQEILRTLYLTRSFLMCQMHRASREAEGMSHNGSQNNETPYSFT